MGTNTLPPLPSPKAVYQYAPAAPGYAFNKEQFSVAMELARETKVEFCTVEQVREAQAEARNSVIDQIVEIIRNTQAGAKRMDTADYILTLKIDAAPTGPAQPDGKKQ